MSNLQNSTLLAAAIGVTVGVISAAGMFLYQQFLYKQQYKVRNHNLELVNQRISELQEELEALRLQQAQQKKKRRSAAANKKYALTSNNSTFVSTENSIDVDTFSTAGTDFGDDEFYDCSDSEEITGDVEPRESEPINELEAELLEIDAQQEVEEKISGEIEEKISEVIYYKLQDLTKLHPNNVGVIWRFLRACHNYINHISDIECKKKIIREGLEACQNVIDIQDGDLHKWYAILVGIYGENLPVAEKIKNAYTFEKHLTIALKLRPEDSILYYLLGRFRYEIASLNWFDRKMAATFFSEPPNATYEEAIESFEQAEQYATKPYLANRLYLSKAYIAINEYRKAALLLNGICQEPAITKDDENVQCEAKEQLQRYSRYL